jgi:uncharacterized protein (TIRG00374 family)
MSAGARSPEAVKSSVGPMVKFALGIAISGLFLYALFSKAQLGQVGEALGHANLDWVALSLVGVCLSYALKTQRWVLMLRSLGGNVGFRQAITPLMGCVALNNVLPFRAGDIVRVLAFRRYTGVQPAMQLGTVILERLLDVCALLSILVVVISFWPVEDLGQGVITATRLIAGAALAVMAVLVLAPRSLRRLVRAIASRLRFKPAGEALSRFGDALVCLSSPALLMRLSVFSFCAWICEGLAYIAVARSVGAPDAIAAGLLALAMGTISTTIPSSPGYVGTFHFFAALALMRLGADRAVATAFAILIHAILWLSTTSVGFLLILLDRARPLAEPAVAAIDESAP